MNRYLAIANLPWITGIRPSFSFFVRKVKSIEMRRLILFLVLIPHLIHAQKNDGPVKVHYEKTDEGLVILANNNGFCPYTIDVRLDLKNMVSDRGNNFMYVIQPQTKREPLTEVKIKDPYKGSSFGMQSTFYWGNALEKPQGTYDYALPFKKGDTHLMSQGYNGKFSHSGKNAIDFNMDIGTPICAARKGIVIEVKDSSNKGCPNERCMKDANNIILYHKDGSFTEYAHLKKNGSKVRPGQKVEEGEVIGLSGNTGFSSGPHLHFEVFYFDKSERVTVKTKFKVGKGKTEYLKEMVSYKAPN